MSVIYCSPSQNNSEFDLYFSNLEQLLRNISKCKPIVSVITGHYNARSSSWWSDDIIPSEGAKLCLLTSSKGFSQLINEPTQIQTNSSSCIDLVFTYQPNLSVNSGVHTTLHPNCHHQTVHTKFNLNISYSPRYQRLIWDYEKADSEKIKKALDSLNWERLFNKKNTDVQVAAFNETILNVFRNYVPNKYITIDDKDPAWMNETIKLRKWKPRIHSKWKTWKWLFASWDFNNWTKRIN